MELNQLISKINKIELKECRGNMSLWDGKSSERISNIISKNIKCEKNKSILICFGTRPEYIKLKSLIENLPNIKTCFTGQHEDLLKNIDVDYNLSMERNLSENRLNNIFSIYYPIIYFIILNMSLFKEILVQQVLQHYQHSTMEQK